MRAGAEPDAALLDASRRGDRTAFAAVIERYQRAVYAVAFSAVRDHALSDDVTQDTFVAAWLRLGDLRDDARLPAWLCGIARNLARAASRQRRREAVGEVPDVANGSAPTPFDALGDADTERLVAAALATVPDVYREPLVLFYYDQRSVDDVARTLGISARTTHKRLSRGRKYLAEQVAAIVERGLGRRGPRADLVAGVLAAIGVLGTGSHVDASPSNTEGSTMSTKLSLALVVAGATLLAGFGLLSADAPKRPAAKTAPPTAAPAAAARRPTPAATSAPASPSTATAATAPTVSVRIDGGPTLTVAGGTAIAVPDCATVARHMADLSIARAERGTTMSTDKRDEISAAIVAKVTAACEADAWTEDHRLCVADADDYERARIDCTDDPVATPDEVAALPADQRCDVLARHIHDLATAPGGTYSWFKHKAPEHAAQIDKLALAARDDLATECDQMPWSVARRTCVARSTTERAANACR